MSRPHLSLTDIEMRSKVRKIFILIPPDTLLIPSNGQGLTFHENYLPVISQRPLFSWHGLFHDILVYRMKDNLHRSR